MFSTEDNDDKLNKCNNSNIDENFGTYFLIVNALKSR